MEAFRPANPLEQLSKLPEWKVKKLQDFELAWYLNSLKEAEARLQEKLTWVYDWKRFLENEVGIRKSAADEIRRRKEKDEKQAKALKERLEALERKHLSDQYAE